MNVIVAVDDDFGMMFNKRRQSQDKVVREKLLNLVGNRKLYMNEYTMKQFTEPSDVIAVDEDFLQIAESGDFCFVENQNLSGVTDRIDEMILIKWNRQYPSDFKLDVQPEKIGLQLKHEEEFVGNSHEKITMQIWE